MRVMSFVAIGVFTILSVGGVRADQCLTGERCDHTDWTGRCDQVASYTVCGDSCSSSQSCYHTDWTGRCDQYLTEATCN